MTANDILATKDPKLLFGPDITKGFRALLKVWHPDRNHDPKAVEVVAYLHVMRAKALGTHVEEHVIPGGRLVFKGSTAEVSFAEFRTAAENMKVISTLPNKTLAQRILPFKVLGSSIAVEFPPHRMVRVGDLISPDGLLPGHVAWIGSRLFEQTMMLEAAGWSHGGLIPETTVLDADTHGVYSVDWRFALPLGKRMTAAPGMLLPYVPPTKLASTTFDLRAVQRLCVMLLGDPSGVGTKLRVRANADKAKPVGSDRLGPEFLDFFLTHPGKSDAQSFYKRYREVLDRNFEKGKFLKMDV